MHLLTALAAATPSPAPSLRPGLTDDQVSPGFLGFIVIFFLALAVVFLIRSMSKRIRRVRYQAQVLEEQNLLGEAGEAGEAGETGETDNAGESGEAGAPGEQARATGHGAEHRDGSGTSQRP
ncbi:hypothetical protein KIH31_07235 [Paenarthrobacter sp. DKR-5]|uniref:hypothetical protein n=1 Tax=Paenarthrobacter sp. DKR-5 TaxID=2835535 RepID=UPI001BDD31FC|nr:hypothetical protein [Paenarthrobacter sp. DKR-5]MBT1002393.1 hypothetical protein [Paenarthrobacter sp. DKR-5]